MVMGYYQDFAGGSLCKDLLDPVRYRFGALSEALTWENEIHEGSVQGNVSLQSLEEGQLEHHREFRPAYE
jgi:hypothetical protein